MSISSVIVETLPEQTHLVLEQARKIAGVEIHQETADGKIIAIIEAPDVHSSMAIHKSLWEIPGVAGVHLAYHYFGNGDGEEDDKG